MGAPVILNGWKEIAAHLGRGVRTVQRWETLGLPIRRPNRRLRSAVVAFAGEVDDWLKSAELRDESAHHQDLSSKPASKVFPARILIVDDDEALLVTTAHRLAREGYDVRTARNGFEALAVLRGNIPDLLISALKMVNMSGFELLAIVRKRFPSMAVIAVSGEFAPITTPLVTADRFVHKGKGSPAELNKAIRELLAQSPIRVQPTKSSAPAWFPTSSNGYVVMVCSECLRPFSVPTGHVELDKLATESCLHCGEEFSYFINSAVTPTDIIPPSLVGENIKRIRVAKQDLREVKANSGSKTSNNDS